MGETAERCGGGMRVRLMELCIGTGRRCFTLPELICKFAVENCKFRIWGGGGSVPLRGSCQLSEIKEHGPRWFLLHPYCAADGGNILQNGAVFLASGMRELAEADGWRGLTAVGCGAGVVEGPPRLPEGQPGRRWGVYLKTPLPNPISSRCALMSTAEPKSGPESGLVFIESTTAASTLSRPSASGQT